MDVVEGTSGGEDVTTGTSGGAVMIKAGSVPESSPPLPWLQAVATSATTTRTYLLPVPIHPETIQDRLPVPASGDTSAEITNHPERYRAPASERQPAIPRSPTDILTATLRGGEID